MDILTKKAAIESLLENIQSQLVELAAVLRGGAASDRNLGPTPDEFILALRQVVASFE